LSKVAVIGIGNPLRRDDGIGITVLESLLKFYSKIDIDYLNFGSASFDLLHRLKDYRTVLLIDGMNAGLEFGELKIFELEDAKFDLKESAGSTHEIGLNDMFKLSRKLGIKTKIYVAGIQTEDISFGEGLSSSLENRKEEIIKKIEQFIDVLIIKGKKF
jgi:hydrogenase maturation protease